MDPGREGGARGTRIGAGLKAAIAILAGLVLLGAACVTVYSLSDHDDDGEPGGTGEIAKLGDPAKLTKTDLERVDRRTLFLEVTGKVLRQRVIHTHAILSYSEKANFSEESVTKIDAGFEYSTKKLSYEKDFSRAGGTGTAPIRPDERCVTGKRYVNSGGGTWREAAGGCGDTSPAAVIGDGLFPSGLDEAQAAAFIDYLEHRYPDFLQVRDLALFDANRKTYLRFVVDYAPVGTGSYGYVGLQHLAWAFENTGLNAGDHPYSPRGTGNQGKHVIYYVDPATGLPAYSQQTNIAPKGRDGKPVPDERTHLGYAKDRYEYFFDKVPDFDPNTSGDITISFPEEPPGYKPKPAARR